MCRSGARSWTGWQVRGSWGWAAEKGVGSHLGAHSGHEVQAIAGGVDFQALQRQRLQSLRGQWGQQVGTPLGTRIPGWAELGKELASSWHSPTCCVTLGLPLVCGPLPSPPIWARGKLGFLPSEV